MHYLIVAKVKDYPDITEICLGLLRQTDIMNSMDLDKGKWASIFDEFQLYWQNSTMFPKLAVNLFHEMWSNHAKDIPYEDDKYTSEALFQKKETIHKRSWFLGRR